MASRTMYQPLIGVLSIGLIAVLAACGSSHLPAAAASPERVSATEAEALQLYENITGGPAQREAVDYLGHRSSQIAQSACVAEGGFKYPATPYIDHDSDYPMVAGADSEWLAPLASSYISRQVTADITYNKIDWQTHDKPSPYAGDEAENQRYIAVLDACGAEIGEDDSVQYPPGYELVGAYNTMMESVDSSLESEYLQDYGTCMKQAGVDALDYQGLSRDIRRRVAAASSKSSDAQDAALQYEAQAISADTTCRKTAHDIGYTILDSKIAGFESDHAETLEELRLYWANAQALAAEDQKNDIDS